MFDSSDPISLDGCAVLQRDIDSRLAASYTLTNLRPAPSASPAPHAHPSGDDFALSHRNLRKWDGYGPSGSRVDGETRLRLDAERTRPRTRLQLCSRVFAAAPNLASARGEPALEARVIVGADTSCSRRAPGLRVSEADFSRFDPGVCAVPVENVVPAWTAGGSSSRDIARTKRFRRALGRTAVRCASSSASPSFGSVSGADVAEAAPSASTWRRLVSVASPGFAIPVDGFGAGSGI
jgi:hypothetical protein